MNASTPTNQTIRRNSKALKAVFANLELYDCTVSTLNNNFSGEPCAPKYAMEDFQAHSFCSARYDENGNIAIRVHSNCWYVLSLKAVAAPAPAPSVEPTAQEVEAAAHKAIETLFNAGFTPDMLRAMTHEEILKELSAVTRRNAFAIVA